MFVCFEGIDGAGKTTQTRMLHQKLRQLSVPAEIVADPGTTRIGTAVRQILLHNDAPISSMAQMLLFSAARAELAEYIREKLAAGVVVLCDRWLLSTLVYQGELNKLPIDLILHIFQVTAGLVPDICFLLDISPDVACARMGEPRDRYERCSLQDCERLRASYLKYAQLAAHAKATHCIRADGQPDETHDAICAHMRTLIRQPV
jgi:dTMP kinase